MCQHGELLRPRAYTLWWSVSEACYRLVNTIKHTGNTDQRQLDAGCDVSTDQRAGHRRRCQSDLCAYCCVASQEESITRATNLAGVLSQIYSSRTLLYNIWYVREPTSFIRIKACWKKKKTKLYKVQPLALSALVWLSR